MQITNPVSGKGYNAAKIGGLTPGSIDSFWLIEYLKFVGFFTVAAPVMIGGGKDRKTFVLRPTRIDDLSALRDVMRDFRGAFVRGTSITATKVDILAALRFTRTLIEHIARSHVARQSNPSAFNPFGIRPRVTDIASGFDVAQYKAIKTTPPLAYATMNLATINLPGWLGPITSREVADDALVFMKEHEQVIASIKQVRRIGGITKEEEESDEIELLRRYRDFLSGNDVTRFFDFAARYGDYYLAKRHRNQWASQLTTDGMETLVAQSHDNTDLRQISASPGFRAIAKAIRRSTVTARHYARQTQGPAYPYEVRYGLGHDLLRQAAYPKLFLGAMGEFLQAYRDENDRIEDRIAKKSLPNLPHFHRPVVDESDLDQIVDLVSRFGSEVVCKMLVAYGYASDSRGPREPSDASDEEAVPAGISSEM